MLAPPPQKPFFLAPLRGPWHPSPAALSRLSFLTFLLPGPHHFPRRALPVLQGSGDSRISLSSSVFAPGLHSLPSKTRNLWLNMQQEPRDQLKAETHCLSPSPRLLHIFVLSWWRHFSPNYPHGRSDSLPGLHPLPWPQVHP